MFGWRFSKLILNFIFGKRPINEKTLKIRFKTLEIVFAHKWIKYENNDCFCFQKQILKSDVKNCFGKNANKWPWESVRLHFLFLFFIFILWNTKNLFSRRFSKNLFGGNFTEKRKTIFDISKTTYAKQWIRFENEWFSFSKQFLKSVLKNWLWKYQPNRVSVVPLY